MTLTKEIQQYSVDMIDPQTWADALSGFETKKLYLKREEIMQTKLDLEQVLTFNEFQEMMKNLFKEGVTI